VLSCEFATLPMDLPLAITESDRTNLLPPISKEQFGWREIRRSPVERSKDPSATERPEAWTAHKQIPFAGGRPRDGPAQGQALNRMLQIFESLVHGSVPRATGRGRSWD
jgi:hypothetical protein